MAQVTYTTLGGITAGAPNTASDVTTAFTQVAAAANTVDDTQYTNQNNSVWRTISESSVRVDSGSAGTYLWTPGGSTIASGAGNTVPVGIMPQTADYAVSGKTTVLRLNLAYAVNGTAPATTFTFGLYPVTSAGGAGGVIFTTGAVVASSTVAVASPALSTTGQGSSSAFALSGLSASSLYVCGVVIAGSPAASSCITATTRLQIRHT